MTDDAKLLATAVVDPARIVTASYRGVRVKGWLELLLL